MKSVGIFGFGRFGKVLVELLSDQYHVKIYDPNPPKSASVEFVSELELLQESTLFIAVPISNFKPLIQSIAPKLSQNTIIFDVCSIKLYPVEIMKTYLPKHVDIIATHPLFGPDSMHSKDRLNFMMYPVRNEQKHYDQWKAFFSQKFNIIEITPDEHDRFAADSQSIVHFIARMLAEAKIHETPIDTLGFKRLLKMVETNCKDSWELSSNLMSYNPYTKHMIERLEKAFANVKSQL